MENTMGVDTGEIKKKKLLVFLAATFGYGLFYVCRLSLNVLKKPIVDSGYLDETQLGIIGSALFFTYAVGKFVNGFLADRINVRYFMSFCLLVGSIVNLILGFQVPFLVFALLWGMNGWFQSAGSPCSVIALRSWFTEKNFGTIYGYWCASHNIGEAITFIVTAFVVSALGWQAGFYAASLLGFAGVLLIFFLLKPNPATYRTGVQGGKQTQSDVSKNQLAVLKNPMIWMLALSSAFMYVARYAVNSWGIYYFQAEKSYSLVQASTLISVSSICGIFGGIFSGLTSDKFFHGNRTIPATLMSALNLFALVMFMFGPTHNIVLDVASMVLFGISIGVLIAFLGGLMAVDLVPASATGAAMGVVGIASYMGAGMQDIVSGILFESKKTFDAAGNTIYDFSSIRIFWVSAAAISLFFMLVILFVSRNRKMEHQY